ncbi:U1 small nuclear ribonucleoprotein 70 kDa-like [Sesbania bispinosa]|nr:U1 small nuclear ribonucleoprotein 70 kDa-like [Sesbania bispinosa]
MGDSDHNPLMRNQNVVVQVRTKAQNGTNVLQLKLGCDGSDFFPFDIFTWESKANFWSLML